MSNIEQLIMQRMREHGRGKWVCTATDFMDLGPRADVAKALARLSRAGTLRRVDHGFFDYPRIDRATKQPVPATLDCIIAAIVRRDGIRLLLDGHAAAESLGLTATPPKQLSFLTNGASRTVRVDGRSIKFRHAVPLRLYWVGRPAAKAVQALHWLGREIEDDKRKLRTLTQSLTAREKRDLVKGRRYLPIWMHPIVDKITDSSPGNK